MVSNIVKSFFEQKTRWRKSWISWIWVKRYIGLTCIQSSNCVELKNHFYFMDFFLLWQITCTAVNTEIIEFNTALYLFIHTVYLQQQLLFLIFNHQGWFNSNLIHKIIISSRQIKVAGMHMGPTWVAQFPIWVPYWLPTWDPHTMLRGPTYAPYATHIVV